MNTPVGVSTGRYARPACMAAAVAVLAVGACRGGSEPSEAVTEPCRLFTRAELRMQFNVAPKRDAPDERYPAPVRAEVSPVGLVGTESCGVDGVYVAVGRTLGPESFAKWKGELETTGAEVTAVKGFDGQAVWVVNDFSQRLVIIRGDTIFAVADTTLAGHGLQRARSLAVKALAKL